MADMKFTAIILSFLFLIWLLPLGVFIKPSQEKIACAGQRAVCMCSSTQVKVKANPLESNGLKRASASQKEAAASSGAGHYFLAAQHLLQKTDDRVRENYALLLAYRNPSLKAIEHIPKA
jgi:hypothetical protein